jgi:small subunit ribosomal protein S16
LYEGLLILFQGSEKVEKGLKGRGEWGRQYALFPRGEPALLDWRYITMATKIRLRRMGARNNPFYRLVVADSRFATTGRYLEVLGWYDPKKAKDNFSVKLDRVDYWQGVGAQTSSTTKSLIKRARAGEGVAPGAAPEKKTVDTQALLDEVPEKVEAPVEPVVEAAAEEVATEEAAPAEEVVTEAEAPASAEATADKPAEDVPEKQES